LTKHRRQLGTNSWITANGYTTTNYSQAAIFQISDGQLYTDGLLESTWPNVPNEIFAAQPADSIGPIRTTFSSQNGTLVWSNPNFQYGYAVWYVSPPNQADGAMIIAWFFGSVGSDWASIPMSAARKSQPFVK
jgi:hypothetical protein